MSDDCDAIPHMSGGVKPATETRARGTTSKPAERPKFVNETVEQRFGCPLCGMVLMNPVQTPCAKRVCRECIFSKFTGTSEVIRPCPLNHDDEDSMEMDDLECRDGLKKKDINADPATRRYLDKERVYCSNEKYGCAEQMEWRKLEDHGQVCKFKPISCSNAGCDVKMAEQAFAQHKEECGFAKIKCDYCNTTFLRNENHSQNCPAAPSSCSICQERLKNRFLMEKHRSLVHFTGPAPCYYSVYGCNNELKNKNEFVEHHKAYLQKHLELVTIKLAETEQDVKGQKNGVLHTGGTTGNVEDKYKKKHRQLEMFLAVINTTVEDIKMKIDQRGIGVQPGNDSSLTLSIEPVKKRIETLERRLPSSNDSETLSQQAREISQLKLRVIELDGRLRSLSSGITPGAGFSGVLTWKIPDYSRKKQDAAAGRNISLYSQPFYSGETGYKMCGRIYLNGDGLGKGKCLSLFFVVMKGDFDELLEWPFVWKVTFSILCPGNPLLDYSETFMPDKDSSSFRRPITDMNIASGCPEFKLQSEVESKYLKSDTLYMRIKVHDPRLRD